MTTHRHIAAFALATAALAACGGTAQQDITAPAATARVLFVNDALNAPGVNFFANNVKLTAISSSSGTESPNGTAYGSVASGGYYTAVAPGQYTFSGRLSDTTAGLHDVAISSVSTTAADGKAYSYYQSGVYDAAAKKTDAFIVEDPIPATFDYSVANVRFVNASYNAAPATLTVTATDSTAKVTTVGSGIAYKAVGAFVPLAPGTYNLSVTGAAATPVTKSGALAASFSPGRYYTVALRGDMTVTSSKSANFPTLDNTSNR